MSFNSLMKIQGQKQKCKDNMKSYSLDGFEQVERSKISKCILDFTQNIDSMNCLISKINKGLLNCHRTMHNLNFTWSPEHSDPHSTLVFPTADLFIFDGQEFPAKVTCLYNWAVHGNKNGPKNIVKCQDFMLF